MCVEMDEFGRHVEVIIATSSFCAILTGEAHVTRKEQLVQDLIDEVQKTVGRDNNGKLRDRYTTDIIRGLAIDIANAHEEEQAEPLVRSGKELPRRRWSSYAGPEPDDPHERQS